MNLDFQAAAQRAACRPVQAGHCGPAYRFADPEVDVSRTAAGRRGPGGWAGQGRLRSLAWRTRVGTCARWPPEPSTAGRVSA